jgi:hypothetical protein
LTSDGDFSFVAKKAKVFMNMHNIEIEQFGETGKLNSILIDICKHVRNQYSHGKKHF